MIERPFTSRLYEIAELRCALKLLKMAVRQLTPGMSSDDLVPVVERLGKVGGMILNVSEQLETLN